MNTEPIPPRPDTFHPVVPAPPTGAPPPAGRMRRLRERPSVSWRWWEAVGVYIGALFVGVLATVPLFQLIADEDLATMVSSFAAALLTLGLLVLWLNHAHPGWRLALGFGERWGPDVRAGILFGIGLYPVIVLLVGLLLTIVFQLISGESVQAPEQIPQDLSWVGVALTLVYAVVVAPIGEELFFRGVLFRSVRDRHGFWAGAAASGVGFGLIHYVPGAALDALLLMTVMVFTGIGFAYIYERRGTIVAPMAAHMTFNVIGLALIYALR